MSEVKTEQLDELKKIAEKNKGVLLPERVLKHAKNPKSSLHKSFEWNDSIAAHKYRVDQARDIIRVAVEVLEVEGEKRTISAFVSLRNDRLEGGYRSTVELLSTVDGREAILDTALWELEAFRSKYNHLEELVGVFSALDTVKKSS